MSGIAIRCEKLTKRYGELIALDGLDLEVNAGSIFGFLGPNGAGKTTTIKMLTGLAHPTSGRAWVNGVAVDQGTTDARHQFGYLPEEPRMYGWMRGREYLVFIGRLAGLAGAESGRRADEMLELTGLREAGRRRVAGYSRGMRQRLGLAQTLVTRPPVILLDEPTSALDPVGRRDVLELVVSLKGTVTVFLSTHILSDVDRICDEVAVLDRGRLITQAGRHELMERYTLPIFEVEFADDGGRDSEVQAAELAGLAWVERVDTSGTRWRVWAAEPEQAKHELPRWLVGTGRTLLRYELTRPNLEDVFVRLVGQSSHPHQVVRVAPDSVVPPSV